MPEVCDGCHLAEFVAPMSSPQLSGVRSCTAWTVMASLMIAAGVCELQRAAMAEPACRQLHWLV